MQKQRRVGQACTQIWSSSPGTRPPAQIWIVSPQSFTDLRLIPFARTSRKRAEKERPVAVPSVNTDSAALYGTFAAYSQYTAPASQRFGFQRVRFIFGVCVCVSGRYKMTLFPLLISSHPPEAVPAMMNHFIFFSGWWRQAFPSQTHCVRVLKGPQTVIQNIQYYIFPSAGKIITEPSAVLFTCEPRTHAPAAFVLLSLSFVNDL